MILSMELIERLADFDREGQNWLKFQTRIDLVLCLQNQRLSLKAVRFFNLKLSACEMNWIIATALPIHSNIFLIALAQTIRAKLINQSSATREIYCTQNALRYWCLTR